MIEVSRQNTRVILKVEINIPFTNRIYNFSFEGGDEPYAYFVEKQIKNDLESYFKKIILDDFAWRLNPNQISCLKRKLKNWDSKNKCWK